MLSKKLFPNFMMKALQTNPITGCFGAYFMTEKIERSDIVCSIFSRVLVVCRISCHS